MQKLFNLSSKLHIYKDSGYQRVIFRDHSQKNIKRKKIQSVHISVYSEQPVGEYQRTPRQIISRQKKHCLFKKNVIHHSRVSSIFATKQGLMSPFISNQLHKLHCKKAKQKTEGIYLKSSIIVHVFSLALEHQTGKNMQLFSTALGFTNICLPLI